MKVLQTYTVTIYVAGDYADANRFLRQECQSGLCVTVKPTTFIYPGGEEAGVEIGLVNYPRFPAEPESIWERAVSIANRIIPALFQRTALVVSAERTLWINTDEPVL